MGEQMTWISLLGMIVTLTGIGISIMGRSEEGHRHLKLPVQGIILGVGAGMGQGVGLVLSKLGIQAYSQVIPPEATDVAQMIPFAGTQIRAIMGLIGFGVTLILTHQTKTLSRAWTDVKGGAAAMGAILLGPFLGVACSLIAVNMTHAGVAQTLMSLTPVFILWPAHLIFGNKITRQEVVGAIIAVLGASLFFL